MPRPAIVIGVGGTGQWVLSWLKKDLLETYGSIENHPLRLLLLDVANLDANVGQAATATSVDGGQYSRYAGIDSGREFIQLPTDKSIQKMRQIDDGVVDGNKSFDHIANWYCGDYYPRGITIDDGAGKFRQLGRLALVQGLHYNGDGDNVYSTLAQMVRDVARPVEDGQGSVIDVHITGSLAGGSGSGMFIDIAWLLRKIIPDTVQVTIMGFFAMPGVFSAQASTDMQAKAFNAWRELNRIMTVGRNNTFEMRWGNAASVIYDVDRPAFDHVYLVDRGPYNEMHTEHPKDSVFPIMAEAISFYLDSYSGSTYVTNVRTNLNNYKSKHPLRGQPTFSTLYVRSWKLPVYHHNSIARHNFAKAYLDALLQVESYTEIGAAGEQRVMYRLSNQQNCVSRAPEMLDANLPNTGNTQFMLEIARIMRTHDLQRDALFREFSHRNLLEFYSQMPNTEDGNAIRNQLNNMINYGVPYVDPGGSRDEIRHGLIRAEEQLYGPGRQGGDYASLYGDFSARAGGDLYNSLEVVERFQLEVFRERVRTWIERELNYNQGTSGLACVKTALLRLEGYLAETVDFFEQIETDKPPTTGVEQQAYQSFAAAYQATETHGPLAGLLRTIARSVSDWHGDESGYNALQRDIRAAQRIVMTLKEMRKFILDIALDKVEAMEQQLVTDNNLEGITGLYRGVLASFEDELDRHAYDRRLQQMMTLLGDEVRADDPRFQPDLSLVNQLVENTTWTIDNNMNVRVNVRLSASDNIELEASAKDPNQTRRLVERLVIGVADRIMPASEVRAIDYILPDNLDAFEDQIRQFKGTLFTQYGTTPSSEVTTFYLRCQTTESQKQALQKIVNNRLSLNPNPPNSIEVVDSENPNKVVVFRARELLLPKDFAEWQASFSAYQREVSGDRDRVQANFKRIQCDHLFAAEKNALELENRYFRRDLAVFPILNFRLVHLLENRARINMFLQMWTLGWIFIEENITNSKGENATMWMWKLPRDSSPNELLQWNDNDTLHAIERFVVGGQDFRGAHLPYDRMQQMLKNELNQNWYNDPNKRKQLVQQYETEVHFAQAFHNLLETELRQKSPLSDMRTQLEQERDRLLDELDENQPAFYSLMEEFAFDLSRELRAEPLVSNIDAHMQSLHIMFAFLFEELADHVANLSGPQDTPDEDDQKGRRHHRRTR